jgi:hypothetical protein
MSFMLVSVMNLIKIFTDDSSQLKNIMIFVRPIITIFFLVCLYYNKTNMGLYNVICFLQSIYISFGPILSTYNPSNNVTTSIFISAG